MKKIKKMGIFALLLLCLALIPAVTANAGFRRIPNGKYRYYTKYTKNEKIYIKNKFKNITSKGKTYTYYFNKNGYMVTGWKRLKVSGKWYWYCFDDNGRMYKNCYKDGYYLQANGRRQSTVLMESGFKKDKKGTRYRKPDGTYAQKEWLCIRSKNGKQYWYYFYGTGYMAKDTWLGSYHVDKNGRLDTASK